MQLQRQGREDANTYNFIIVFAFSIKYLWHNTLHPPIDIPNTCQNVHRLQNCTCCFRTAANSQACPGDEDICQQIQHEEGSTCPVEMRCFYGGPVGTAEQPQ